MKICSIPSVVFFWLLSCVRLFYNPIDSSLPGFSVYGIFQAAYWSGLPFPTPSLIIREMQIKSTMRYHLMTLRMAVIRKARIISAGETWRKGNSHTWLVGMWIDSATKKTSKKIPCSIFLFFFFSVQFSSTVVSDSLRPHESQHARPPCPSPTPRVHPNPCPLSRWCHPTISSSVVPFSSCPQIFPSIRVFSNESALHIRWPKYWSFSFNISPSKEHSGLIYFRMDWLDLFVVQGTLKSLLQHHSSKLSILWCSAVFIVQLSHPYMTTGQTTALTRWTFVGKVMSLLLNMLSRLVITFLPRSKHLLISWLQSPSAVILELRKIKSDTVSTDSPSISHEATGPDAMILVFWMLSLKPTFSLSSFTFIKRLFSSSSLSAIRVVSSAYLRWWIFLLAILIPACASSSPAFLMMYSAYKLNKQGDSIQPWRTPFPIWNQSVVPCPVLTVASWPAYRFLKRQIRWSGIAISFRIFHSLWWSTQSKALA